MSKDTTKVPLPCDDEILVSLKALIGEVDIETMGQKSFIKLLAKKMNVPKLSKKKEFILESLTKILNENENDSDDNHSDSENESEAETEEDDSSDDEPQRKKKKAPTKGTQSKNDEAPKKSNPFNTPKELSKPLADFIGKGSHMSRPQVVKSMWEYIHEHKLQNPENKKEIILDDNMKKVFGVDRFTMFRMAKFISAHIHPFKPVPTESEEEEIRKRKKLEKPAKKRKKAKTPTKRKFATYRLSQPLVELTGFEVLTRQKVIKHLINYTKENELQVCIVCIV